MGLAVLMLRNDMYRQHKMCFILSDYVIYVPSNIKHHLPGTTVIQLFDRANHLILQAKGILLSVYKLHDGVKNSILLVL